MINSVRTFGLSEETQKKLIAGDRFIECIPFISNVSAIANIIGKGIIGSYTLDCVNNNPLLHHIRNKSITRCVFLAAVPVLSNIGVALFEGERI